MAYSAFDQLDLILRSGAPAEAFARPERRAWLERQVLGDIRRAIAIVAALVGDGQEDLRRRFEQVAIAPPARAARSPSLR
jgi:hypothetical protein